MRVADLDQLSKLAEELRRVEDSVVRSNDDLQRIEHQIKEQNAAVAALLSEASAESEAEFLERADAYKQRLLLSAELDRIPPDLGEPAMLFDLHDNVQEAFDATKAELATRNSGWSMSVMKPDVLPNESRSWSAAKSVRAC